MNKKLVLLPISALMLSGCSMLNNIPVVSKIKTIAGALIGNVLGGSSTTTTAQQGGNNTTTQQGGGGGNTTTQQSGGASTFDLTAGTHTAVIDIATNYADYKEAFAGYVTADSGVLDGTLAGLSVKTQHCFIGSYSGVGYIMMQNQKSGTSWNAIAFMASATSLGSISKVEILTGSSASPSAEYTITFSNSPITSAQTEGTKLTPGAAQSGSATGSGAYFAISATNTEKNGQIAKLTVTYTI